MFDYTKNLDILLKIPGLLSHLASIFQFFVELFQIHFSEVHIYV